MWQFANSMWSTSHVQQPIMCFAMLCCLRYWLFCNPRFSFDILYVGRSRRSIDLLCSRISTRYLGYQLCNTKICWHSIDAHFQNPAGSVSLVFLPLKAANIASMDVCNQVELRIPKMQNWKLLTLRWRSFSELGSDRLAVSLAYTAANMSVMHNSDQIMIQLPYLQDQKLLMLHWCSFSKHGSDCVAFSFAYTGRQYVGYA